MFAEEPMFSFEAPWLCTPATRSFIPYDSNHMSFFFVHLPAVQGESSYLM
jgi:hypothetical protein